MATNIDRALDTIKKALKNTDGDFNERAEISLDLLDAALGFLDTEGALAKVSVEVHFQRSDGGRFVRKYSLGLRGTGEERAPYLKKTDTEEYE